MGLYEALTEVSAEKKARGKATIKYVSFTIAEWDALEAKHGKKIDPVDVKKLVLAIFEGKYALSSAKK